MATQLQEKEELNTNNTGTGVVIAADNLSSTERAPSFTQPTVRPNFQNQIKDIERQALAIKDSLNQKQAEEQAQVQPSFRDSIQSGFNDLLNRDTTAERQAIREDSQLVAKEEESRRLSEEITRQRRDFEDQLKELKSNPEGKGRGALQAEINDFTERSNRTLADLSFSQSIALGNYQAAEKIANQQLADMEKAEARQLNLFQTAFNFAQNDMSESEKLQANQLFQEQQAERSAQRSQDLARFNFELAAPQRAFDNQIALERLALSQQAAVSNTVAAPTLTGKPQTAAQSAANGFADRVSNANKIFSQLDGQFSGRFNFGGALPNALQSDDRQSFEQAKRNFVNAVLRRESGAAISPTEFESAEKQYFEVRGDSEKVRLQKAANRNTIINNLYREANVVRPVGAGDIIESGGKQYQVESDGVTLKEL